MRGPQSRSNRVTVRGPVGLKGGRDKAYFVLVRSLIYSAAEEKGRAGKR